VLMGSIRNNFIIKEILPEQGVIAFVSQWRSEGDCVGGVFFSTEILSLQFISLVVQRLMRYAVEKNKRLMIIPRYPKHSDLRAAEESYFRELLGCEPVYLGPEGLCSGYMAVDSADVVVAIDSTLGYESIARGNKTAIFSIRSSSSTTPGMLRYGWPGDFLDEGPFWTNNPDPDKLVRILDYLFEVNDIQWREDVRASNFSSLMVYDPGNTTLKSTLEEVLGPPPL
jgi:surface carbohydrate biosynthesis protein